jgi:hypothetical protein
MIEVSEVTTVDIYFDLEKERFFASVFSNDVKERRNLEEEVK